MTEHLWVVTCENTITIWDREDLAISHHTVVIGSNLDSLYRKLTPQQWEDAKSRLDMTEVTVEDMRSSADSQAQQPNPAAD